MMGSLNRASDEEQAIHQAACETVLAAVTNQTPATSGPAFRAIEKMIVAGVFVTLRKGGRLRGCCGTFGQPMSLARAIVQSGYRTATADHRFPPVAVSELSDVSLDVTILSNFETIEATGEGRVASVEVGRHGLVIQLGQKSGLLLPSVAVEFGLDARGFLNQVCRKAGLAESAWLDPNAFIRRFEGRMIGGPFDRRLLLIAGDESVFPYSASQMSRLARIVTQNVAAILSRAVPACFPAEIPDGTVGGIAVQLSDTRNSLLATFSRIPLSGELPLQSTLLQITQSAAEWLLRNGFRAEDSRQLKTDLALFASPVSHGNAADPDVAGFDGSSRAILVSDGRQTSWSYDSSLTFEELLHGVLRAAGISEAEGVRVRSFRVLGTASRMQNSCVSQAERALKTRPPAVSGVFYPAEPEQLRLLVKKWVGEKPPEKERWPAVMVPHAGLIYSGAIAAGVLNRVEIPSTVIIIGPKHTRYGANWAIAPNALWQLPGAVLRSDLELAAVLERRIDGLELDAEAHEREHAIEVELPILEAVAPECKIAGIVVGAADLEQCLRFGQQLAAVIREVSTPSLLVISSDMNHFEGDARTRELDEMALLAMESCDPTRLYETVTANGISMCGVRPAVMVMEALRTLGQLTRIERAGYATSGDVTGDESRVVGYAGMLLGT